MKYFGILMSADGPDHNVIKIKPPLTYANEDIHKAAVYFIKLIFKVLRF
jgi:4-aminobutyrate aminotransferase-like enzyme